ncbi:MAG: protein kinase [archaeon]
MEDLHSAYVLLIKAKSPEDIFGTLAEKNDQEKKDALKDRYRDLAMRVHPDRYAKDPKSLHEAEEAIKALNDLHAWAEQAIDAGTYGTRQRPPSPNNVIATFEHNGDLYRLFSNSIEGDFGIISFGERIRNGDVEDICLKTAKEQEDNDLLKNEQRILKEIQHKSLPLYLDAILLEDGTPATVLRKISNSYDLLTVKEHFPQGLPQEHAVWVLDRLLSVLGYLHINNTIHGAIEPGNIMITPYNHNGLLIDYLLAVPDAHTAGAAYKGLNEYSAPELTKRARPHPAADMYALGKTMVFLLGGQDTDLPDQVNPHIQSFIKKFLVKDPARRESDAWQAWHELKNLRQEVFGAPSQFLTLTIGGR